MLKDKVRELISPLTGWLLEYVVTFCHESVAQSLQSLQCIAVVERGRAAEGTFKYHKPSPVLGSSPEDQMTHLQRSL